jgi:hypothetical protein
MKGEYIFYYSSLGLRKQAHDEGGGFHSEEKNEPVFALSDPLGRKRCVVFLNWNLLFPRELSK